ncbi:8444_t:CDS:2 [Funneliformis caledonium]|uniref:8444_t:CDS:1 n=1 Tax=Funneliformis caledonium TaxID=1117310 RepID=A0A9N9H9W5_9GLOM|nr:8444_t:CDS:2 [Funneliformis caledonium]
MPVILEVKNDNADNAFKQACKYYWRLIQSLEEGYTQKTHLSCLLLCLNTSHLRIANAFYNRNYLIEGLTKISLDCFKSIEPKRIQIIGRILLALKKALLDDECEMSFKYEEKLTENKFVYVVETINNDCSDIPKLLVVKFVTSYGLDVYKSYADKDIASKVYGYKNINCDWKIVTMEYLSDYKLLIDLSLETNQKIELQKKIKNAVQKMHSERLIYDDLWECNILYKKKEEKNGDGNIQVKIIDFNWGEKEEVVRYPPRLNPIISWPLDIKINQPIK